MAHASLIVEDIERAPVGYDRMVVGATALGRALTERVPAKRTSR